MSFYLKHHFDPDWDPSKLKPEEQVDGSVDHMELHFVRSVSAGDVVAEWISVDEVGEGVESRFVFDTKDFPAGKGTGIKKNDPDRLYAAVDGYARYTDGKIVIRSMLNVRRDVDYHTGNIDFISDVTVMGSVRSGFEVNGRNVIVKDMVEGAHIQARHELRCVGGVKGGKEALVEAGKTLKIAFCEYGTLKSLQDVLIKGSLMHSDVYVGKRLAVGGRLTGGNICTYEYVFIGEQLGGGLGTDTSIILGYKPALLFKDQEYNKRIKKLHDSIASYEKMLNKNDDHLAEYGPKLEAAVKELQLLKALKVKLWDDIYATERLDRCKVVVPGVVKPGVEISIGSAYLKVDEFLEDVYFYYENDEVKIGVSTGKHRS